MKNKKRDKNNFLNILKAFRLERPLIPLSSIMLVVAFANKVTIGIIVLMICCILMYAVGGLINAKIDHDYKVKNSYLIIFSIFAITLILSLYHYIIFLTVLLSLLLGFIYSKYSRFLLFGDSIILGLTHSTLPIISAALLLSLNSELTFKLAGFMFFAIALVAPMKNLKGVKEDKKRGYKTLMTKYKDGKKITNLLLNLYLLLLFLAYFIFNLNKKFLLIFSILLMLGFFINYLMANKKEVQAYRLVRLVIILFSFAIVFSQTSNLKIILLSFSLVFVYFTYLSIDLIKSKIQKNLI